MFYRSSPVAPTQRRPGVVLLVVMAMLALFASLALSFVFYADSQAVEAGYSVTAQTNSVPDIDPEMLANYFLSNFIYDSNNPYSAGRGWSLARSMYGYNPGTATTPGSLSFTPYNGAGRAILASSAPVTAPVFGAATVDYPKLTNYQQFSAPTALVWNGASSYVPYNLVTAGGNTYLCIAANQNQPPATNPASWLLQPVDPLNNQTRTPEFYGKASDGATYRFVGGANPPWTAYDTNSLFLAEMTADGNVQMPSFFRPWNATPGSAASRYTSMSPDPIWNPAFYPLPDADDQNGITTNHVKNLDYGPGMNDSKWMDWGYPIMTAPNGKRYKPLFAPLIVDMSNKLHLWAHGNNLGGTTAVPPGVSNMGLGSSEVSLNYMFGIPISSAVEAAGKTRVVTITTTKPHGLVAGQQVLIAGVPSVTAAGVPSNGYDGTFTVLAAGLTTTPPYQFRYTDAAGVTNLKASSGGFVYTQTALNELQTLYQIRYGAGKQAIDTTPTSVPVRPGTWASLVDANGMSTTTSLSSRPFFIPKATVATSTNIAMPKTVPAGGVSRTVTVVNPSTGAGPAVDTTGQFPVYFFDIVAVGSTLVVGGTETVTVTAVNAAAGTFTANFQQSHGAGTQVVLSSPSGFPTFPLSGGWDNANAADMTTPNVIPLAFNLFLPNGANTVPLPLSHQEAMLRWGGTNSPALTSTIFRQMPLTFGDIRKRNMLTLANTFMDRVTSAPYLNFNRNTATAQYYSYINGMAYPALGKTEIQTVTVTGTAGTFKLQIPGQAQTAAIAFNASAAVLKARLQATLAAGGTVTVTRVTVTGPPAGFQYTVVFGGTLSNQDVGQIVGTGTAAGANPAPIVTVATAQNGAPTLFPAPNYGVPASIATSSATTASEFSADMRSALSQLLRVDLSRPLTDYPSPTAGTGLINTANLLYARAVQDRQQFARDIYNALVQVTGARDPSAKSSAGVLLNPGMQPTAADYQAARWLAQLAVNIVDYIDNDDYSTPFNWNPGATATTTNPEGWVFGTELPRLVLDEAYAQLEPSGQYNFWAELYNPFKSYAAGTYAWSLQDNGAALLQLTTTPSATPPYIIEIHNKDASFTAAMQNPANPTGYAANPLSTQTNWGTSVSTQMVLPGNGVQSSLVSKTIGAATANPATAGASHAGATVTIRVPGGHGLTVGAASPDIGKPVTITGVATLGYNGTFTVATIPNATHLTYNDPALASAPITPSGGGTVIYGGNPNGPAGTYDQALGFYVVGPQSAAPLYTSNPAAVITPSRNPGVLATYLSPAGMSFTIAPSTIKAPTAAAGTTGVSHAGTTVTVNLKATSPLPLAAAVGDPVVLQGVTTQVGKAGATTSAVYNNSLANPNWTITSINAARTSFTFTYTGTAALPAAGTESGNGTVSVPIQAVTLQLRKLANPHLQGQANPNAANYNPYITVDSFDIPTINTVPNPATGSFRRTQPYGAATVPAVGATNMFFQNPVGATYNWLVHLDRPPVNALELLHVSGYRPHELTKNFVTGGVPYGHYAPWNPFNMNPSATAAPNALIYRALDQMSTHYMAGQYVGGRSQGNVNLNTVTELEVWQALCDAHDASSLQYPNPWFTQQDVATLFGKLIASRNNSASASLLPTSEGAPFKSFSAASTTLVVNGTITLGSPLVTGMTSTTGLAVGAPVTGPGIPAGATVAAIPSATSVVLSAPATSTGTAALNFVSSAGNQVSMNDTWFRPDPTNPARPLFAVGSTANHPYLQASLLQKIYNNITTTSNVFAVWWTVGYFEVVDETVKPARLGQEIGRAQNQHIRHRFFAIVDRSGLQLFNTTSTSALTLNASKGVPQSATMSYSAPAWVGTQSYVPGSFVSYTLGGSQAGYYCIAANTNAAPTSATGDANWQPMIQPGMLLEIVDNNPVANNSEVVAVQSVTGMTITANFAKSHAAGVPIICRGNPGPKTIYNPHDDPGVVLHMSVIK